MLGVVDVETWGRVGNRWWEMVDTWRVGRVCSFWVLWAEISRMQNRDILRSTGREILRTDGR